MQQPSYRIPASTRPRCPVCGESVYSKAGIHPQCAVKLNDPPPPKPPPVPKPAADAIATMTLETK